MTGFFGKVPSAGDFVRRQIPVDTLTSIQKFSTQLRHELLPAEDPCAAGVFKQLPPLLLGFAAGVLTAAPVILLVRPSRDSVGREWPLIIAAETMPSGTAEAADPSVHPWINAAMTSAIQLVEGRAVDEVAEDLWRLTDVAPTAPKSGVLIAGMDDTRWTSAHLPSGALSPAVLASLIAPLWGARLEDRRELTAEEMQAETAVPAHLPFTIESGSRSHVGTVRALNEDSFLADDYLGLWAVADGVGGLDAGDVASRLAIDRLAAVKLPVGGRSFLQDVGAALSKAHQELQEIAGDDTPRATTIVTLQIFKAQAAVFWAGDSRCYHLHNGALTQLSRDHSHVQALIDAGAITEIEARTHSRRNIILRAVGAPGELELDSVRAPISSGDKFLLCTDGLHSVLSDDALTEALRSAAPPQQICDDLVEAALAAATRDNVTAVVVAVGSLRDQINQHHGATSSEALAQPQTINVPIAPIAAHLKKASIHQPKE